VRNATESDTVAEIQSTGLSQMIEAHWQKSLTKWKHTEFTQADERTLQNLKSCYREAFIEGRISTLGLKP